MLEKMKDIICNCVAVDPEEITCESKLSGDLGLSSLDLVMVSVEIEKEFGVKMSNTVYTSVKTVGGLIDYISKEQK
ncbi:MAG: acyl carrier protein [Clostridia bacterium]|nr:acyl carrier protein [Clostridia bacterium]